VNEFLANAERILEAAGAALRSGHSPSEIAILIDGEASIHIVAASDWPLESLKAHHGARLAYRVSQNRGTVRVEGRSGSQSCVLERELPGAAHSLLCARY
jgi:hypothetical protein